MKFVADLHLHSHFSRATSKKLDLEHLSKWAQLKGVTVVGTGDFTHPGWLDEVEKKLEPAEEGLFKLKTEFAQATAAEVPKACRAEVRFLLTTEISNIYKRLEKVRKVHNLIFAPSTTTARKIQAKLETIGNIRSDGRPILGLDSRDLLEITLEADPLAFFIPAHIWTPWFSMLGSKGGFDAVEDCFADLTPHIFAVETGLSSDPPMNWRLQQLDRFVLVSNSDAHSPQKLAREANLFDTKLSYPAMLQALKDQNAPGFLGTIEFFPEEGKYHYDGHRLCKTRLHPSETQAHHGNCPVCGKPVTVGVMARVEELADRPEGEKSPRARQYENLIPLPEIIGEAKNQKPGTKGVEELFQRLLAGLGNELFILREAPLENIERIAGRVVAEGVRRMRAGEVKIAAGYDGEYGTIHLFTPEERERLTTQVSLLDQETPQRPQTGWTDTDGTTKKKSIYTELETQSMPTIRDATEEPYRTQRNKSQIQGTNSQPQTISTEQPATSDQLPASSIQHQELNPSQQQAVTHGRGHLLIVAGPGTGKTHTLAYRIAYVAGHFARPEEILAITFTNKAAEEMRQRVGKIVGSAATKMAVGTFHAFCLRLVREYHQQANLPRDFEIIGAEEQHEMAKELWPAMSAAERENLLEKISRWKATGGERIEVDVDLYAAREIYDSALRQHGQLDFDDLLVEAIRLLENNEAVKSEIHHRYHWIFVDEYQDLNAAQHRLLVLLVHEQAVLTAIGDPNQAIYGFRGADVTHFSRFKEDFAGVVELRLAENYRSAPMILSASTQVIDAGNASIAMPLSPTLLTPGRLTIHAAPTEKAEAEFVVHQIEKMVGGTSMFSQDSGRVDKERGGERSFGDFAVLYRLNALRPALEEALARSGMPYQISGDTPLLSRRGVRELATAIRCLFNMANPTETAVKIDLQNLARVLQFAVSGVGEQTAPRAATFFQKLSKLETNALDEFMRREQNLAEKQKLALLAFSCELQEAGRRLSTNGLAESMQFLFNLPTWKSLLGAEDALSANFQRVLHLARSYDAPGSSEAVRKFFDALSLEGAADHFDGRAERIALMTLHAAKGLEFPVVFIVGCEETLLPMQIPGLITEAEEERRLFYVGMTRAKEQLYLLRANRRPLFGRANENPPSRFLANIEEQLKAYEKWQAPTRKEPKKRGDENQLGLF